MRKEKKIEKSEEEEQGLYLGEFLVRIEFFTKECFDRLILIEAKIGVMTEVMMSLRDVINSYLEIDGKMGSEIND